MVGENSKNFPEQTIKNDKNIPQNKNEVFGIREDVDKDYDGIFKNVSSTEKLTVSINKISL